MNMNTVDFDIVIVGAGIAGSALACALGESSLSVALVEGQTLSAQWPVKNDTVDGFDSRVSALAIASQYFLDDLGVWSRITQQRVSPYQKMHVWDADGTGCINFSSDDINQPVLGHIVENRLTMAALLSRINELKNIHVIDSVQVSGLKRLEENEIEATYHELQLSDGRQLRSPLIVAADGAHSHIRTQANFAMREWDYGHNALVATVKTSKSHQNTAWQRFMLTGPLAFLPLCTNKQDQYLCSIVWSASPTYANNLMALSDQEFKDALGEAFEFQLGEILDTSSRFSFPLRQRHAKDYIKPGIALVGDAAHTIHPLAGQGINLGLLDVQVLGQEILRAEQRQLNSGSLHVLRRFQRRRKGSNLAVMAAMEGFKRLFEQPALPVRWARNTGMRWLDNSQLLKHRIMREAMGL